MDVATLALELAKIMGPTGAVLGVWAWLHMKAKKPPVPESVTIAGDVVVQLLTEIRDGIREEHHQHKSMMGALDRIERRQSRTHT